MVRRNELGFEQQHIEEKLNYSTQIKNQIAHLYFNLTWILILNASELPDIQSVVWDSHTASVWTVRRGDWGSICAVSEPETDR